MATLDDYHRTRDVYALLRALDPSRVDRPEKAVLILRAAGIPELRIGGALLWKREHVDTLLADLRRSRQRTLHELDGAQ